MRSSAILIPLLAACGLAAPTEEIVARDVTIDQNTGMPIGGDAAAQQVGTGNVFSPNQQNPNNFNQNGQFPNQGIQFPNQQFNGRPTAVCGPLNSPNRRVYDLGWLQGVVQNYCNNPTNMGALIFINQEPNQNGGIGINNFPSCRGTNQRLLEFPLSLAAGNGWQTGNNNPNNVGGWRSGTIFNPNNRGQGSIQNGVWIPTNPNVNPNFGQNGIGQQLPQFENNIGPDMVVSNGCQICGVMTEHAGSGWNNQGRNTLDGCTYINWNNWD